MKPRFCENCGSARDETDKFCTKCGSKFPDGKEAPAAGEKVDEAHDLHADEQPVQDVPVDWGQDSDFVEFESGGLSGYSDRNSKILGIAVILPLLAAISWYFASGSDHSAAQSFVVTGTANVRNAPTTEGSDVLSVLEPGDYVTGEWVEGSTDSSSQWLHLVDRNLNGYVWEGNLRTVDADSERKEDLSSHFGTQGHFCDYLTKKDILIPESATHLTVKDRSKGDFENLEVWKFAGTLHGLTVLGIGEASYEGGYGVTVIFDNTENEILAKLRPIYGGGPYGIPGKGTNVTYREEALPLYISSLGAEVTASEYGFGKSALMCGAID